MPGDITSFYQQCDPVVPLPAGDPRYVDFGTARGESDMVGCLVRGIRRASSPLHILFSGHRGAGKSTELLRLVDRLRHPPEGKKPFFVVYYEADEVDIDVNDVDLVDVVLSVVRSVAAEVREKEGLRFEPPWFKGFLSDVAGLLHSDVEFEKLEFDAKVAKVTATIQSSKRRLDLRQMAEPQVSLLLTAANQLLLDATVRLRARGYEDLLVVVDNLDRIVLRDLPDSRNTHTRLFIDRGTQLAQLGCHLLYTIPISMVFSPAATTLQCIFNRRPDVLPMVRVVGQGGEPAPGLDLMRQMVWRRLGLADVAPEAAFDSDATLDYLCLKSGGHPRNLLILLRSAADRHDELPITRRSAELAVRGMRIDFERALNRPEYYEVLRSVESTRRLPGSEYDQLLLYNTSVLEYMDMDEQSWYAVNPVIDLPGPCDAALSQP